MTEEFESFNKIARLSREVVITEKIDGTNAQIYIYREVDGAGYECQSLSMKVGSRSRWITPEDDNHGFARWAYAHRDELVAGLGEGRHYGEWWGSGIQRGYGLTKGDKRFSLFNTARWGLGGTHKRPECCSVVPSISWGMFNTNAIDYALELLRTQGSYCSPGFMNPEGIVIYHTAAQQLFKKTLVGDEKPKGSKE
jgi:hypothetical protein